MSAFDVIIVGYGPTGKVLARLLSDAGHSVALVERWPAAYPLPRAVGYDNEIKRMFHGLGLAAQVEAISRPMHHYVWYNADWKVLLDLDYTCETITGDRAGYLFNQPELERVLEHDLKGRPGISLYLTHEALSVSQTQQSAQVTIAPFSPETRRSNPDKKRVIEAKFVVGCDGANSMVRECIGSNLFDHGFDARWLVVDVRPHDLSKLPIPDAAQWCNPERPTTIVPSGVTNRRWEFMIKPGEKPEDFVSDKKVWELLSRWMKPTDGALVRRTIYRFRSLLAQRWRKGRILIAGDAAHQMPPFMGQGMCAGLRDAWNLAWKLDRVLAGKSSDRLLDDYETERAPHVDAIIRMSIELGKIICVPDPEAAKARDAVFFSGKVPPPPPPFPGISAGAIAAGADGRADICAGQTLPHDDLEKAGVIQRLDEIAGRNFALIYDSRGSRQLDAETIALADRLGVRKIPVGTNGYHDVKGRLSRFLGGNKLAAVVARPDFYAFGGAETRNAIGSLLKKLAERLAA